MATLEKPKRGFLKFYKFKSKNNQNNQKPNDPNVVTIKPMMSPTVSLQRKSDYSCEESVIKPMMSPTILLPTKSDYSYDETIKPMMSPMIMPRKYSNYSEKVVEDGPRRSVDGGGRKMAEVEAAGRRSVSHIETNLASVVAFLQVKVLVTDMPGFMQVHAFKCARKTYDSLEKFSTKQIAYNLKKEFDKVYGPAWHCIVGSSFGSFVTHSTGGFLYFSMENLCILIFKTKVQKSLD